MSISFRAVQAAAQAIYEASQMEGDWDDKTWIVQEPFFRMARAALNAGAPRILRDVAARIDDIDEQLTVLEVAEDIEEATF